jgi:hypothetical protein
MNPEMRFEEDHDDFLYRRFERSSQIPGMIQWMISKKIIGNDRSGRRVLLAFSLVCVVLAVIIPILLAPSAPDIERRISPGR